MRIAFFFLCFIVIPPVFAQTVVRGIIADSTNRQPLSFASVQAVNSRKAVVSDINGHFSFTVPDSIKGIIISYSGYQKKLLLIREIQQGDTLFLNPSGTALEEIVIRPVQDKIKWIINAAIENKERHNPEFYDDYQCNVYYKMHADLKGLESDSDEFTSGDKYILLTESYSKRLYKRPQKLQEVVLASRFSGLKKTYFTNMVTDVLPFHVYNNYITLNEKDYINPIAAGWQQRYQFTLDDELIINADTVYTLSFKPKAAFNSLQGIVYINSNGYAISHIAASTNDTAADRRIHFEQIYSFTGGRWFPKELNYDFTIKHMISREATLYWNGHSIIDNVTYTTLPSTAFDKAHPVILGDSVDLQTAEDWTAIRKETLSPKEQMTYQYIDSFVLTNKLEQLLTVMGRLAIGRLPVGKLDIDVNRLILSNDYEGTRLGAGLYTNDKISRFYSLGGWVGYGFNDKAWKYGGSLTIYPNGKKENWIDFGYQKNYGTPGEVILHEDLQNNFNSWLLGRVDLIEEYKLSANAQLGYWQVRPEARYENTRPLYGNNFKVAGKSISHFTDKELSIGFRYAYGEKKLPVFDYYEAAGTKYPIGYIKFSKGVIASEGYKAPYTRILAAVTYSHHTIRWGKDNFKVDGGFINSRDSQPVPQSYLLAGNGYNKEGLNYYSPGGFITMKPFDYYSDQYIAFYYKHDFDKFFWNTKWSKPFLTVAHNSIYGSLNNRNEGANAGIRSFGNSYHETGSLLNHLLRLNIHIADLFLNGGVFYHWNKEDNWKNNHTWAVGISAEL